MALGGPPWRRTVGDHQPLNLGVRRLQRLEQALERRTAEQRDHNNREARGRAHSILAKAPPGPARQPAASPRPQETVKGSNMGRARKKAPR